MAYDLLRSVIWLEVLKAIFGLISHLAWAVLIGLAIGRFHKEIARLIDRIWKLKFGDFELEAAREEAKLALENTKELAPEEVKKTAEEVRVKAEAVSKADIRVRLIPQSPEALTQLAVTNPREAVIQSWSLLERAILIAGGVAPVEPRFLLGREILFDTAVKTLMDNGTLNQRLLLSIRNLKRVYETVQTYDCIYHLAAKLKILSSTALVLGEISARTFSKRIARNRSLSSFNKPGRTFRACPDAGSRGKNDVCLPARGSTFLPLAGPPATANAVLGTYRAQSRNRSVLKRAASVRKRARSSRAS